MERTFDSKRSKEILGWITKIHENLPNVKICEKTLFWIDLCNKLICINSLILSTKKETYDNLHKDNAYLCASRQHDLLGL